LALGEEFFTESFSLRQEFFLTLGEELFAESPRGGSRQRKLLTAKGRFPVVELGYIFVFRKRLGITELKIIYSTCNHII
jgi:hypothetical protein